MFCVSLAGFLKIISPGVWFQHEFSAQGVGVLRFLCACTVENSPFQIISGGKGPGFEVTDT